MISIKGKMSFDEYLECQKFISKKRVLISRSITFICGIFLLCLDWYYDFKVYNIPLLSLSFIYIFYALCLGHLRFKYLVKKNWKKYPKIHEEFSMNFCEDGMQTLDDKGTPSHLNWGSFMDFKESENLFLLFLSPSLPICIPKRLVAKEDLQDLKNLALSNIKKEK
ncbi:MAG: YcxB family protein [Arcobacter sp.]|nr:YcxB family protein [Arcobacter sp.]